MKLKYGLLKVIEKEYFSGNKKAKKLKAVKITDGQKSSLIPVKSKH